MIFFTCMHITCVPQALVGKKRGSDLLELELEILVIMMWVLETEPRSSAMQGQHVLSTTEQSLQKLLLPF